MTVLLILVPWYLPYSIGFYPHHKVDKPVELGPGTLDYLAGRRS